MISAARHPLPATYLVPHATEHCSPHATCLTPPGAWHLQLNKSLDHVGAYSGGVEFSMGSFWPMENSEFVGALANRRL